MNLLQAQQTLAQLISGGAFRFDTDLPTVSWDRYQDLLHSIEPESYEVAYEMPNGLNIIEKLTVDRSDNDLVELLRIERTWEELGMRVFELELRTVPSMIVIELDPKEPSELTNTWWLARDGTPLHYRQMFNGEIKSNIGILSRDK